MYETVLVPTDGSEGTERTLDHALDIARTRGATLHALSVVDRRVYISAEGDEQEEIRGTLRERADEAIERVAARAEDEGVDVVSAVRDGVPPTEIVRYADEEGIDLIVIGTHGRSGREKIENLGSVTERVVEDAERPVLVVHIGDE